jgi:HAE1 family hydrophobic/amphiphilic exporter-1
MWITRVSIDNPVFATMLMVACLVLGLYAYQRLPVEQFPDVSFPVVVVQTAYPGAAPETVENEVTRKIEEVINSVSGLKTLSSRSFEGQSLVIAEFELSVDAADAAQEVRDKVGVVKASLRREIDQPKISRFNPDDLPILSVALSSVTRSPREVSMVAELEVKRRLENVRGVGQATLVGAVRREIQVRLRPGALKAYGVGVDQVLAALRADTQEIAAGSIENSRVERLVLVDARVRTPADFAAVVIGRRGGEVVRLGQLADVADAERDEESVAAVNGRRAVSIDIVKARGANTIDVVDRVLAELDLLRAQLPAGVQLDVVRDTSVGIRASIAGVKASLVEGAALTVLIVFLFLNSWRSTVITGLTLPIALIGGFWVMYACGFTLNVLTLLALSLCVGVLIDDAIVVRENIVRHLALGRGHRAAALDGTSEIALAVLATTFSIVAVFLPVGFMGGIIGRFFHQFGITIACAVLLSMFVSFTLDPMLSSVWPDPDVSVRPRRGLGRLYAASTAVQALVDGIYARLLAWSLGHRKSVLLLALLSLVASFGIAKRVGSEFVPEPDFGEVMVQFYTPVGSSLAYTHDKLRQVDAALREFPEVRFTYGSVNSGVSTGKNSVTLFAKLTDKRLRQRSQKVMQVPIRARLARIAGITTTHVGVFAPVSSGKPLQVSVQGADMAELQRIATTVREQMAKTRGVVDLDWSLKPGKPAVTLLVDRDYASELGLSAGQVGAALRVLLAGEVAGSWLAPDGESYDVRVRLARDARQDDADLGELYLAASAAETDGAPRMVPLRQVARFVPSSGASQINRRDLSREVLVTANVSGRATGDAGKEIAAALRSVPLPPGYRLVLGGSTKDIQETMAFAMQALALAVVFIYLILASQFRSFLLPVAIMASLPLSLVGVMLALWIARSTLNIFSIIGLVMLMGLVTKNAILLVDFINRARADGLDRNAAIASAGRVRLRPILMTTAAMVCGMLPLALALTTGSEHRAPMAHAVIGGIITSTLLTLVVVPVLYTYLDDFRRWAVPRLSAKGKNLRS